MSGAFKVFFYYLFNKIMFLRVHYLNVHETILILVIRNKKLGSVLMRNIFSMIPEKNHRK